jgi:hypothetical protein
MLQTHGAVSAVVSTAQQDDMQETTAQFTHPNNSQPWRDIMTADVTAPSNGN